MLFVHQGRRRWTLPTLILAVGLSCAIPTLLQRSAHRARADEGSAPPPPAPPPAPSTAAGAESLTTEYRQYEWQRGGAPVRMISKDEGFCFLSAVGGHFAGGGESVRVYIGEDGFWYLGGSAAQELWGKAMSVKFSHKLATSVVPAEDPNETAWHAGLPELAKSDDAAIKELAKRELAAMPSDPEGLMGLADAWNAATAKQELVERRLAEAHVLHLYAMATGKLDGDGLATARHRLDVLRIALANRQLNDLAEWKVAAGNWSATVDNQIEGSGDCVLDLKNPLPADCFLEFHVNVVEGMRPRIEFPGTGMEVGNEGDFHQFIVVGAETQRGVSVPYVNGQELKFGVKFAGKAFEFYSNGELMAKGTRTNVPQSLRVILSGGDGWSPGTTRFWGFKVSAS